MVHPKSMTPLVNQNRGENKVQASYSCPICNETSNVQVDWEKLNRYLQGEFAQVVFPDMDIYTRDILISGVCIKCQKKMEENHHE